MPWEDGLSIQWNTDDVFVNPAFSEVGKWLAMAVGAWMAGDANRVFFVTAANTGTLVVVPPLDRVIRVSDVLHRAAPELHRSRDRRAGKRRLVQHGCLRVRDDSRVAGEVLETGGRPRSPAVERRRDR